MRNVVKMVAVNNFFVKTFIFFFVLVCVVVAEHQKRDVHRIILQQILSRNHNRGQAHNHGSKKEPKYKKAKLGNQELLYSSSFEDSGSYSDEKSFENNHHQKMRKPSTKKSPILHRHHIYTNLDVQESRHHPHKKAQSFYNEWLPVNYDHLTSKVFPHINIQKDETKRKSRKKTFRNIVHEDFDVSTNLPHNYINPYKDLTTSHNSNLEQSFKKGTPYESSTFYPPIDVLSTFSALNKKALESNTSLSFDVNIQKDTLNALKNHNFINYDNNNESSDKDLDGYIVVPENSQITSLENIHNKLNSKNRGSIRFNEQFQS